MELLFFVIHECIVHLILARPLLLDLIIGRTCHPVFSSHLTSFLRSTVRSDLISSWCNSIMYFNFQGTLFVWLHTTKKLWSCNFIKLQIWSLSSSTALLCVSVDVTRGRDAAWQRVPLVFQMSTIFLKHAAEGCLASGCLQAVITQLLLPDTTKVSRSGEEQRLRLLRYSVSRRGKSLSPSLTFPISHLPSIFHDQVNSN